VPFTVGTSLPNSLAATDVVATPTNMAPAPSNPGMAFWTLGLQFPTGNFTSGKSLHFTIGRGEQHSSEVQDPNTGMANNGATIDNATGDIWGGGVLIPENTIFPNGMKFSGTISDGSTFSGFMVNQIGNGYSPLDGYGFINAEAAVKAALPAVQLTGVVSRKVHGTAGTFDIDLPLVGNPGIECRNGGTNNTYTLVFTFANPLKSVSSASVTSGTGSVVSKSISTTDAHQYIVNLTGVIPPNPPGGEYITVTLANLSDTVGDFSASISATMGVLVGDVNGSGRTDNGDAIIVRNLSGTVPSDSTTARADVNCSGRIDNGDAIIIRNNSGAALPPSP
jgi:Dockerin type I domain